MRTHPQRRITTRREAAKIVAEAYPERMAREELAIDIGNTGRIHVKVKQRPPVDYYLRDGHISRKQFHDARRLYGLWFIGALHGDIRAVRLTDMPRGIEGLSRLDAWQDYRAAIDSIRDSEARGIVISVVCWEEKPRRNVMDLLKNGLDDLYEHFKLR